MSFLDDSTLRFVARHPSVDVSVCYCCEDRGLKCAPCCEALLRERATLREQDLVVAFLTDMGRRRLLLRSDEAKGTGRVLLDAAALVEEGVHRAGSA